MLHNSVFNDKKQVVDSYFQGKKKKKKERVLSAFNTVTFTEVYQVTSAGDDVLHPVLILTDLQGESLRCV